MFSLINVSISLPAEQIPQKYIGKWKGVSGKMEASDAGQTGTATTKRDLGNIIEEFEFEVKEDGKITGQGKAKYWFNVSAQADLLVTKVGPTAYLEGGAQTLNFKIEGEMKPDGKVKLAATPEGTLTLINAGKRGKMDAWNVFGPYEHPVSQEGCKTVIDASNLILGPPITMKIAWKAERDCKADCEVDRMEPGSTSEKRTSKIEKVIIHCTGGLHENCNLSQSYKSGTLGGIVREFRNAEDLYEQDPVNNKKKSIHYIVGRDGAVVRMIPDDQVAYHNYRDNQKYVGIELINNGDGNDPYLPDQIVPLADLVAEILRCNGLDSSDVLGHGDVDPRLNRNCNPPQPRRTDPGSNFPWESFRTLLDARLAESE